MNDDKKCLIWGTEATINESSDFFYEVSSSRAGGLYKISRRVNDDANWQLWSNLQKALLTTWLIDQHDLGIEWPEINSSTIKLVKRAKPMPVHERADRLLKYLAQESPVIGSSVSFHIGDPDSPVTQKMLAWTESTDPSKELYFLLTSLSERNWTEKKDFFSYTRTPIISVAGYARLAELATKQINSSQGFVAMWFDASMNDAYEKGIAPGIKDAGYEPLPINRKEHINKIDDEIIAEIRRSRFVVADFTHGDIGPRGGVYYEAGFAHGLNIPVFFTCRKDVLDKVHFDTRQYNHIVWETPQDLRKQLADRISAVIGDGPNKPPRVE